MSKKGFAPIVLVVIIAIIAVGGLGGYAYLKNKNQPVACTMDAKLCPDGSSVGRIPPKCEFAECPTTTTTISTISVKEETSDYILGDIEFTKALVVDSIADSNKKENKVLTVVIPGLFVIDIQTDETTKYTCATETVPGYGCGTVNRYCYVGIKAIIKQFKKPMGMDAPVYGIIQAKEIELLNCDPFPRTL